MVAAATNRDTRLGRRVLRRNRIAISAAFIIAGAAIGSWTGRIPAVQHDLGLTDDRLSIALLALAGGGLAGMRLAGRLGDRLGPSRVMTVAALAVGATLTATAFARDVWSLSVALVIFGVVHGALNVTMNAAAVVCQNGYQRPIMTSMHALFSIGGAIGAGAAAVCAHTGLDRIATFGIVGFALTVAAAWLAPRARPPRAHVRGVQHPPEQAGAAPTGVGRRVWLLGLLAFCALLSEGAAADWSSVYLDRIEAGPAAAATAYAAFAAAMTIGRLAGDRLATAFRPHTLLRVGGLIAGVGIGAGVLAGTPVAAIAGFGLLGVGLSCAIPQLYSAAGNLHPTRPGAALSRVAALGYLGFVTGPVAIGGAAARVGLDRALLLLPVLTIFLAAAAHVIKPAATAAVPPAAVPPSAPPGERAGVPAGERAGERAGVPGQSDGAAGAERGRPAGAPAAEPGKSAGSTDSQPGDAPPPMLGSSPAGKTSG
ncbi:MFS transporter [Actinoplanes sp. NPDC049265]|uniref:MFS transporter n=1 Tax=Actinoplanes sp. NPDC049265 TaxID=3363902 RepID=UPI003721F057